MGKPLTPDGSGRRSVECEQSRGGPPPRHGGGASRRQEGTQPRSCQPGCTSSPSVGASRSGPLLLGVSRASRPPAPTAAARTPRARAGQRGLCPVTPPCGPTTASLRPSQRAVGPQGPPILPQAVYVDSRHTGANKFRPPPRGKTRCPSVCLLSPPSSSRHTPVFPQHPLQTACKS